jgi:putative redox protein
MAATVTVHGGSGGLQQEIHVGRHRAVADEPVADGGTDAGPTPYDYLLAALGA